MLYTLDVTVRCTTGLEVNLFEGKAAIEEPALSRDGRVFAGQRLELFEGKQDLESKKQSLGS